MKSVLVKPIITEKSVADAGKGKFTFLAERFSNKHAIKQAVEQQFTVHVTGLSTSVVKGKRQRSGVRRIETRMSPWKKAIVTLKVGEKIDLFDLSSK